MGNCKHFGRIKEENAWVKMGCLRGSYSLTSKHFLLQELCTNPASRSHATAGVCQYQQDSKWPGCGDL